MAPWPCQPCPHVTCGRLITDLLAEMIPEADQLSLKYKALSAQLPGGAITCPYCQGAIEYLVDRQTLAISAQEPLRYSRVKMEMRARDSGNQRTPPIRAMTPEQWVAEDKLMPDA